MGFLTKNLPSRAHINIYNINIMSLEKISVKNPKNKIKK